MNSATTAEVGARRAAGQNALHITWVGVLCGLAWLGSWFYGIAGRALGEPDEGRYAEVAREMWISHDWVTPRLDGFNFFDKPPLHYWATAAAYSLFGVNPWSARLWCALMGLLAMAATGWAGARLFGRETGGYAMVILGSALLFTFGAHINTLDMGVTAFLTLGIACFAVAQLDPQAREQRSLINIVMWVALALAVLSKGLIGVVLPAGALVIYMLWQRDWGVLGRVSLVNGTLIVLTLCLPWFAIVCYRHADFFDYFFIREHFTRFLTSADHRQQPMWFFVPVILAGLFPWTVFLPCSRTSWRAMGAHEPAVRFLMVWVGLILVFFSISHSKLPLYILPLFPALALLMARSIAGLSGASIKRRLWIVAGVAAIGAVATVTVVPRPQLHLPLDAMRHALYGVFFPMALWVLASTTAALFLNRSHKRTAIYMLALVGLLSWQLALKAVQTVTDINSAQPIAQVMARELTPSTKVYMVQRYVRGLSFYLGRLVTVVDHQDDDLTPALKSRPDGYIDDMPTFEQIWRQDTDAMALVPDTLMPQWRAANVPYRVMGRVNQATVIARSTPVHP